MIKKKYFLLLSMLLLIALLGLSGTCYAFEPTKEELKNFFWNYAYYFYGNTMDAEGNATNLVNNLDDSKLDEWLGYISRYQGKYVLSAHDGKIQYWCYTGTEINLNNHKPSYLNGYDTNSIQVNNSYISSWIWTYNLNTNTFSNYLSSSTIQINYIYNTSASQRQNWFYTDTNVWNYSNQQYTSIRWSSGYMTPEGLFDGPYHDSSFEFVVNNDAFTGTAKIYGDTSNTDYYLLPYNSNSVRLGFLYDSNNLDNIVKRKYRYNQANRDFELTKEYVSNINDSNFYASGDGYLNVYEFYQPDTTEFIIFTAKDSSFNQIVLPIYYITKNTNIVGGYINLDDTFSGDYYNNYNNDMNTEAIIGTLEGDSPEQDSKELTDFLSGDTDDIADKFGFDNMSSKLLTLGFPSNIYDRLYNFMKSITDLLMEEEDVYFDFQMHGETPTRIYSNNIYLPNGVLKTFIQLFLVTCTVFLVWKQFYDIYESLVTLNFIYLMHDLDVEKTVFKM